MRLYLSSYRVPAIAELETLIGKPLSEVRVALIPNAKDYYAERAWKFKIQSYISYFSELGASVTVVDLRTLSDAATIQQSLSAYDLIWAVGGNTFCLRSEMRRSGFDAALPELLASGIVYGGDSAGALVAGRQIGGLGVEMVDTPEFAETVIQEGLGLIPEIILPHADDPAFKDVTKAVSGKFENVLELKNSEALIVDGANQRIVTAPVS